MKKNTLLTASIVTLALLSGCDKGSEQETKTEGELAIPAQVSTPAETPAPEAVPAPAEITAPAPAPALIALLL